MRSSRKKNAEDVVEAIADVAGDFVMATAGADLESVLAGKGAQEPQNCHRKTEKIVANLDIGGGTTEYLSVLKMEMYLIQHASILVDDW